MWKFLRRPWLAPLLEQSALCRGAVIAAIVLGLANVLGLSLFPCPFSTLTGLPCAGCGITRSMVAWFKGDWRLALQYHPLSPGVLVFGALLTLSAVASTGWRQKLVRQVLVVERATSLPTVFLLVFLTYGFLRMGGVCPSGFETKNTPFINFLEKRQASARIAPEKAGKLSTLTSIV